MGCDIHAYAEIKRSYGNEEVAWYCCETFQLNPYYFYKKNKGESVEGEAMYIHSPLYFGRNYALFEALAGVRGEMENCIFDFKGHIPDDCSGFIRSEYEQWQADAHSPSYITLKELVEADGMGPYKCSGYFNKADADLIDKGKGNIKMDSRPILIAEQGFTEYREFDVEVDILKKFKDVFIASFKSEKYLDYCSDERVLEEIKISGDDYRIIFWFDN